MNQTTYLVRWKGQQFGPFTKDVITQKVTSQELSLAHEIQVDGQWRSARVFLGLQPQEQERQKVRFKKIQDELDEKQIELEDAKTELNEIKKRPTLLGRSQSDSPNQNLQPPDNLSKLKSKNPIDRLKEQLRRKS